jgi:hypothetical protein
MRKRLRAALIVAGIVMSLSGCAALEETRKDGAHFATWQHMGYSLWRATPKDTTKRDIDASLREKWWGDVIRVEPIL